MAVTSNALAGTTRVQAPQAPRQEGPGAPCVAGSAAGQLPTAGSTHLRLCESAVTSAPADPTDLMAPLPAPISLLASPLAAEPGTWRSLVSVLQAPASASMGGRSASGKKLLNAKSSDGSPFSAVSGCCWKNRRYSLQAGSKQAVRGGGG